MAGSSDRLMVVVYWPVCDLELVDVYPKKRDRSGSTTEIGGRAR